jgi:hypothetical protein
MQIKLVLRERIQLKSDRLTPQFDCNNFPFAAPTFWRPLRAVYCLLQTTTASRGIEHIVGASPSRETHNFFPRPSVRIEDVVRPDGFCDLESPVVDASDPCERHRSGALEPCELRGQKAHTDGERRKAGVGAASRMRGAQAFDNWAMVEPFAAPR